MKEYIKNKRFIPYDIYKQSKQINSKIESRIILVFFLVNILLFSFTTKENRKNEEFINEKSLELSNSKDNSINYLNIIKNCNLLFDDDIVSVNIENGEGNIVINNLETIKKLEQNKDINLNSIDLDTHNSNYRVRCSVNE